MYCTFTKLQQKMNTNNTVCEGNILLHCMSLYVYKYIIYRFNICVKFILKGCPMLWLYIQHRSLLTKCIKEQSQSPGVWKCDVWWFLMKLLWTWKRERWSKMISLNSLIDFFTSFIGPSIHSKMLTIFLLL